MSLLPHLKLTARLALKFALIFEGLLLFATLVTIGIANNTAAILGAVGQDMAHKPLLWVWWSIRSVLAAWVLSFIAIALFKTIRAALAYATDRIARLFGGSKRQGC